MRSRFGHLLAIAILLGVGLMLPAAPSVADASETIYWANGSYGGSGAISFTSLIGSSAGGLLDTSGATVSGADGVAIDAAAGRIYWANYDANKISYANLDNSGAGGDLSTTGATVNGPVGLAIDPMAGRIYWGNANANKISYANLDGSGGGDVDTAGATVDAPEGVALDPAAGRIYWANRLANKISYANLDGSGGGDLNTSLVKVDVPDGVAVEPNPTFPQRTNIYWTNAAGSIPISFVSVDGDSGAEIPATGATDEGPQGLAIDTGTARIYWANNLGAKISLVSLISGGADVPTEGADTSHGPNFPVILQPPSGAGLPEITGAATVGSTLSCSQGTWAPDIVASFLYRVPQTFSYWWSLDGSNIAGATSSVITATATGAYRCLVTAANQAGTDSQTSDPFIVPSYALTIFMSGSGAGTVMSAPNGISCGAGCSARFAAGTRVTLAATPSAESRFAGWGGACTGTGPCDLTMKADHDVSAGFEKLAAPDTKITKSKINSRAGLATFAFTANGEHNGFQCQLKQLHKAAKFTSCRSPRTYQHLRFGKYTFAVRAIGPGGSDLTPAKRKFKVG